MCDKKSCYDYCWNDVLPCSHLKNISDPNEEPECVCDLDDPENECPYKVEVEE